jgi:hypothetical protein
MAYFEFHQNNSGGSFVVDDARGIGPQMWIEADSVNAANERAETLGLYWDGCSDGRDCSCCGDRWYPAHGDGEPAPEINATYDFRWHDTVYVHHADGRLERIKDAS